MAVIIPALNEEKALGLVLRDIPRSIVDQVIVVDNGSSDNTSLRPTIPLVTIHIVSRRQPGRQQRDAKQNRAREDDAQSG